MKTAKSNAELHAETFPLAKVALDAYLEYRNDYLTLTCFARSKGISEELAECMINEGRALMLTNEEQNA